MVVAHWACGLAFYSMSYWPRRSTSLNTDFTVEDHHHTVPLGLYSWPFRANQDGECEPIIFRSEWAHYRSTGLVPTDRMGPSVGPFGSRKGYKDLGPVAQVITYPLDSLAF